MIQGINLDIFNAADRAMFDVVGKKIKEAEEALNSTIIVFIKMNGCTLKISTGYSTIQWYDVTLDVAQYILDALIQQKAGLVPLDNDQLEIINDGDTLVK